MICCKHKTDLLLWIKSEERSDALQYDGSCGRSYGIFLCRKGGGDGAAWRGRALFFWNWINIFGLSIIALLLIPNIIYAIKNKGGKNLCENRCMNVLEQIGRHGSMLFMVVCLRDGGYGFSSVALFLVYVFGNLLFLIAYWTVWGIYFYTTRTEVTGWVEGSASTFIAGKHKGKNAGVLKMSLAVLPSCLFLLSGITLGYVPLVVSAILFAIGHIYVTYINVTDEIGISKKGTGSK